MQPQLVYLPIALWRTAGDINPDTAIVPADVLSKQALDGQAEDLAMEDTLYALEKAMQAGSLTPDVYIKQVWRPLSHPLHARHAAGHEEKPEC